MNELLGSPRWTKLSLVLRSTSFRESAYCAFLLLLIHGALLLCWPIGGFASDSGEYLRMMAPSYFADLHPKGYGVFLAGLRLLSKSPVAPFAANHLLSAASAFIVYLFARRAWSFAAALAWTLVYALGTSALLWSHWLLSEPLSLFFLALQVACLFGASARRPLVRYALFGALAGLHYALRSASLFTSLAMLLPNLAFFHRGEGALRRTHLARVALALASALVCLAPFSFWSRAERGSMTLTAADAWNLFYGRPATAACRASPSQTPVERDFCAGFADLPPGAALWELVQLPGSPGQRLLAHFDGSMYRAGPTLRALMLRRILRRPGMYLFESFGHLSKALWKETPLRVFFEANEEGHFFRDPAVEQLLRERFPGRYPRLHAYRGVAGLLRELHLSRISIVLLWAAYLLWLARQRRRPQLAHLVALVAALGAVLVAFGEPRYFAPMELMLAFAIPLDHWRSGREGASEGERV